MGAEIQEVMVVPRHLLVDHDNSFVTWSCIEHNVAMLDKVFEWRPRSLAETLNDWVQPIPVAILRDDQGRYCVLRRVRNTRDDLRGRLTLVIGGHVEPNGVGGFMNLLENTLRRELHEELNIACQEMPTPLGVVVDPTSLQSSRHIAFVFEVNINEAISIRAPEEFTGRSKYSGQFLSIEQLTVLYGKLDPWSTSVLEDYLNPALGAKKARQRMLPIELPE